MSKKLFRIFIFTSIGLNFMFIFNTNDNLADDYKKQILKLEEKNDLLSSEINRIKKKQLDSVHLTQSSIKKEDCTSLVTSKEKTQEDEDNFDEEFEPADKAAFMDDRTYQEESEKYFKAANQKISEFLEIKLGLSFEQINLYEKLKVGRSQEIDKYIDERMNQMKEQGNSTMILSMEDSIEIGRINQKYLDRFKKNIGSEAYSRYQDFKRDFNNKMANDPNNQFPFLVEF